MTTNSGTKDNWLKTIDCTVMLSRQRLWMAVLATLTLGCDRSQNRPQSSTESYLQTQIVTPPLVTGRGPARFFAALPSDYEEIQDAARYGLPKFLQAIPAGKEAAYGFDSRESFGMAELGSPIRMVTYDKNVLIGGDASEPLPLRMLNEWRFPVLIQGRARALLTVSRMGDRWEAVDMGAASLAAEIDSLTTENKDIKGDYIPLLLRLYHLKADILLTAKEGVSVDDTPALMLRSYKMLINKDTGLKAAADPPALLKQFLPDLREMSSRVE